MLSKEVLILLFLVLIFLCLVSWTSVEKEAFNALENQPTDKIAEDIKNKRESQDEQEKRLVMIEKMINDLESKVNSIKDNFIINPSKKSIVNKECSHDDPYCLINNNYSQMQSTTHWATKLS
jgi:septal ring factor EnvC (AmiA/AmiB activator)